MKTLSCFPSLPQMTKSFKGASSLGKFRLTMSEALQAALKPYAPSASPPNTTTTSTSTAAAAAARSHTPAKSKALLASSAAASASDAKGPGAAGAGEPGGVEEELPAPSVWDPPSGKDAKAGHEKVFPGYGKGIFWPKMPCLRCGCPWWQGEDWDAQCIRCEGCGRGSGEVEGE